MNGDMHEKMDEAKEQLDREDMMDTSTLAKSVLLDLEWLQDNYEPKGYSEREALEDALKNQREIVKRLRGVY